MSYVIAQSCCNDTSCVFACPVNCIHPTPDEPDFATAEMLYVDPSACVGCGACVTACPVGAIMPVEQLAPRLSAFAELNAAFYREPRDRPPLAPVVPAPVAVTGRFDVAIVGSGPAAMYAADEVLLQPGARVTVYERLAQPYGLARYGVAPDHRETRAITALFDRIAADPRFRLRTGVEVGRDLTHEELVRRYDAVIYAVGAATDRRLGVPGESLTGCVPATDFVAWYNGHPDAAGVRHDLSGDRAVVVGNGNVAIDVARILTADPRSLAATSVAPAALAALRASRIEEVVLLARRGPEHSAFTVPALIDLIATPGLQVVVDGELAGTDGVGADPFAAAHKLRLLRDLAPASSPRDGRRRVVLRYGAAPRRILGEDRVTGVACGEQVIDCGLVLTAIGYRGVPVPGLPFDEATGTVPHERGRVAPGVYVAGWIERGPRGFLGTNRTCSRETVRRLLEDIGAGLIATHAEPGQRLRVGVLPRM
ncbi:MAG: 4Fe-4S dicluster domain-containing protein [Jatrophihabitans sp.]|nr:MAG: 4Fe-4S dicluster domain-containing protein [Jatrophihabitans sp.]